MKGCMGQRFCNAVVWIAELVRVKKSWKLVEISLTTFLQLVPITGCVFFLNSARKSSFCVINYVNEL